MVMVVITEEPISGEAGLSLRPVWLRRTDHTCVYGERVHSIIASATAPHLTRADCVA